MTLIILLLGTYRFVAERSAITFRDPCDTVCDSCTSRLRRLRRNFITPSPAGERREGFSLGGETYHRLDCVYLDEARTATHWTIAQISDLPSFQFGVGGQAQFKASEISIAVRIFKRFSDLKRAGMEFDFVSEVSSRFPP